jgi:hypothetical protein
MKNIAPIPLQRITIHPIHWDIPLKVELLPYLRFTRSMNRQLREMMIRNSPIPPTSLTNSRRFRSPP